MARLSLEEGEDDGVLVQRDECAIREVVDYSLVGCFLTTGVLHYPAMKSILANIWYPVKGVQISDLGEKKVFIYFLP